MEKNFTIAFKALKPGVYTYDFKVDSSLFEQMESPEIMSGDCLVRVELRRLEAMLDLAVEVLGEVVVECDRCLAPCPVKIAYEDNLVVKFSEQEQEFDGEIMWLNPSDDELDLTQYIYESIVLSLPYQRVHPDGECDPDMMARFKIVTQSEFQAIEEQAEANEEPSTISQGDRQKLEALKAKLEGEK